MAYLYNKAMEPASGRFRQHITDYHLHYLNQEHKTTRTCCIFTHSNEITVVIIKYHYSSGVFKTQNQDPFSH